MDETTLYEHILGIEAPWFVEQVDLDKQKNCVTVYVSLDDQAVLVCPECSQKADRHDTRTRRWRHLDTCQLETIVEAQVPRIRCKKHGNVTLPVPWADKHSRYTQLFEAKVIDWLQAASVSAVCRLFSLSWTAVDGIMQRAINRGLARRPKRKLTNIFVDETAYLRRRKYVTIVSDALGNVIHIAEDSKKSSLHSFYDTLTERQKASIQSVSMDMSPAYINATLEALPDARSKIAFDKFHVVQALNKAVDETRKSERLKSPREMHKGLERSRFLWLKNSSKLREDEQEKMASLLSMASQTAKAWELKELAVSLWGYKTRGWARRAWEAWQTLAEQSGIKPMRTVAGMIRDKLWGILNAIVHETTNAQAESINSKIKMVKAKARGFRNQERFKRAILFYCGGLKLHP